MKRYRKRTDLEIALSPVISSFGRMPTPKELSRDLGGDPSDWGRILKGQQKISGEYHARLKLLKHGINDAWFELRAAEASKKYGERTRKGRIAPHTKHIFNDLSNFNVHNIIEKRMSDMEFKDSYDEYGFYLETGIELYSSEYEPKTYTEQRRLETSFIGSLMWENIYSCPGVYRDMK
jgi:hypothetical protein